MQTVEHTGAWVGEALPPKRLGVREIGMLSLFVDGHRTSKQNGLTAPDGSRVQNNEGQPYLTSLRRVGMLQTFEVKDQYAKRHWEISPKGLAYWDSLPDDIRRAASDWRAAFMADRRRRYGEWLSPADADAFLGQLLSEAGPSH